MKKLYLLFLFLFTGVLSYSQSTSIVISQVYGGGGNTGSQYTHDYIELLNISGTAVNISGWSLQYASATSTTATWAKLNLPSVVIQPGTFYLIQMAAGATASAALPTPDFIGTTPLGANAGKVALVNNTTVFNIQCPTALVDFVGYGNANCFEGTGSTSAPSNTTAILRINNGFTDTDNNDDDFVTGAPNPRNSAVTLSIGKSEITNFALFPNPVKSGRVFISSANNGAARNIQIFDVLGKQVVVQKGTRNSVDISHLTKGVYILKVEEEGKTATRKLVVE